MKAEVTVVSMLEGLWPARSKVSLSVADRMASAIPLTCVDMVGW